MKTKKSIEARWPNTFNNESIFSSLDFSSMFWIVMDEHVFRDAWNSSFLQTQKLSRDGNLESPHVARITRIFQAILVTLEEEFELKPEKKSRLFG